MKNKKIGKYTVLALMSVLLSGIMSHFASSMPDALERVAIDSGFIKNESHLWSFSLFPDYQIPVWADNWWVNSIVGILGVLIIFACLWLLGKWLTKGAKVIG